MKTIANFQLPIKTVSEANSSEHWTKKSKRRRGQKLRIKAAMRAQPLLVNIIRLRNENSVDSTLCRIKIVLTRIAPRALDVHDNLPMALKGIVDQISSELTGDYRPGRADDSEWISWEYRQEKSKTREYAIKIEIIEE